MSLYLLILYFIYIQILFQMYSIFIKNMDSICMYSDLIIIISLLSLFKLKNILNFYCIKNNTKILS